MKLRGFMPTGRHESARWIWATVVKLPDVVLERATCSPTSSQGCFVERDRTPGPVV
jgi:hypothetical protein